MRRLLAVVLALLVPLGVAGPRAVAAAGVSSQATNQSQATKKATNQSQATKRATNQAANPATNRVTHPVAKPAPSESLAENFYTILLAEGQVISPSLLAALEKAGAEVVSLIPELGALGVRAEQPLALTDLQIGQAGLQKPALVKQLPYPADKPLPEPWHLNKVGHSELGKQKTALALIDSGVNGRHNDLLANFTSGTNLVPKGGLSGKNESETGHALDVKDRLGAGSLAAGVAAGAGLTKGLVPNLPFTVYRVFDDQGVAPTIWFAQGIVKAVNDGAKVIAVNLGDISQAPTIDQELLGRAFTYAAAKDVLLVVPAGSSGQNLQGHKGLQELLEPTLVVAAVGKDDTIGSYANFGLIDLVAPGGDVRSESEMIVGPAYDGLGYAQAAGGGLASAQVAAAAAAIRAQQPDRTAEQTKACLLKSAKPLSERKSPHPFFGWGLLHLNPLPCD